MRHGHRNCKPITLETQRVAPSMGKLKVVIVVVDKQVAAGISTGKTKSIFDVG